MRNGFSHFSIRPDLRQLKVPLHERGAAEPSEIGELHLQALQPVLPPAHGLVPDDQAPEAEVASLLVVLDVVRRGLQREHDLVAGEHDGLRRPTRRPGQLLEHRGVHLGGYSVVS